MKTSFDERVQQELDVGLSSLNHNYLNIGTKQPRGTSAPLGCFFDILSLGA